MEEKLSFVATRVDNNSAVMLFDNPKDTKTAYRIIKAFLGEEGVGIYLVAKPQYAIILDKFQGGWYIWKKIMRQFVTGDEKKYFLTIRDNRLVSKHLPMVL